MKQGECHVPDGVVPPGPGENASGATRQSAPGRSIGKAFCTLARRGLPDRLEIAMSTSSPVVTAPVTFPARLAWLQQRIQTHVRPYHLAVGAVVGLVTAIFAAVIVVVVLIVTNFNVLGWIE